MEFITHCKYQEFIVLRNSKLFGKNSKISKTLNNLKKFPKNIFTLLTQNDKMC